LSVSKKTIEVKKAKKTKNISKEKPSTKIIIRNIAFEATKDDIKNLFKNFGEVKTIRLPKKMDNNHRGFAFVEFVTIEVNEFFIRILIQHVIKLIYRF
jgi:multiple RNA-binding domain-containing protein 1